MSHFALAYYYFTPIENPYREVKEHKRFFKERDVSGRIYISEEGINGQMSGSKEDCVAFMGWLRQKYPKIQFKIHTIQEHIFPRMTVKTRKQLVAIDTPVALGQGGEHVTPKEWREMIESDEEYLMIDVRNDYEWKIGHFEGAELPPLAKFRDFPKYADGLKESHDPKKTKVMMYCTGGIRCELYSALLKERGFETVFQLEGGVIAYGQQEGSSHWKGKLFVFDDRLAIPIDEKEEAKPISSCDFCKAPSDTYYNCANMDCNTLFLCCEPCIEKQKGCCSEGCLTAPRLRPYLRKNGNRPFRKKHLIS
ncbi:MAG: hypothetical protein S4CHLAM45_00580 [Chlamydiales bacterium]|nr:hypothetical protein [Chlamydiales bacterium]MCH9619380.1 hypothetical protein [Chlamydiales bacterium]MCH9622184.1 hypothetical protein [Chlamydiales bacterium]